VISGTKHHLKGLSDTRWNCRSVSLQRLREHGVLKAAVETIEHVCDITSDGNARGTAVGLLSSVRKFEFIICLCALSPVLSLLNTVSEYLQQVHIDLLEGHGLISALKKELATLRTDGKWDEVLATATEMATELDIDTVVQEERKKKVPRRIDDSDRNTEGIHMDGCSKLKVDMYYNTLDRIATQLTQRFLR